MKLLIKKIHNDAITPTYGSKYAAGLDLYAYGSCYVTAHTREIISTGICIEWVSENDFESKSEIREEQKYYLRIAPRSGLSAKYSIDIGAGVIDYDYRGEIKICFVNNSDNDYIVNHGDKIAQAILERIETFSDIVEVEELSDTTRGIGGFGSTGK